MEKIDGVADIQTDISAKTCSFRVTKPGIDFKAKLVEFAKTNSHLKDYTIVQ